VIPACADEPKNHDFDVIRDEARVPAYQLPPILISAEGQPITTPEQWFKSPRSPGARPARWTTSKPTATSTPAASRS